MIMIEENQTTEESVRKLRDSIYGTGTDSNWEGCKENWMKPDSINWLKKTSKEEKE